MNHSLPGVNAGYITRDKLLRDHLREQQARISAIVLNKGEQKSRWLMLALAHLDEGGHDSGHHRRAEASRIGYLRRYRNRIELLSEIQASAATVID